MKILVVDDSRAMRLLLARTLRQAGFGRHTVLEAADGAQGLTVATAQRPDAVLADWTMPRVDGLQLLQALRAGGDHVPFGFVTASSTAERRAAAETAGALFCVGKPVSADLLGELLEPVLGAVTAGA